MTHTWNPGAYARHASFVPELGVPVADLLRPRRHERILDLGCGDGALTARLAASGAEIVAVDGSPEMVAVAAARGLDARVMSGERLAFASEFDAVFSNAALHWMLDADAVLTGVRRALRPGGRFVAEFGGHGNVAAICTALHAALRSRGIDFHARFPWYFPTSEEYAIKLEAHDFALLSIGVFARPTPLTTGIRGWFETFALPFVHDLDDAARREILEELLVLLAPSLQDETGRWTADYVRLRFAARLREPQPPGA